MNEIFYEKKWGDKVIRFLIRKLEKRQEVKRRAERKKVFMRTHEDFYKDLKN